VCRRVDPLTISFADLQIRYAVFLTLITTEAVVLCQDGVEHVSSSPGCSENVVLACILVFPIHMKSTFDTEPSK